MTVLPVEPGLLADRSNGGWLVVARRTFRGIVLSGALWGILFGVFVATSAWSYNNVYKTQADRDSLAAAFSSNISTSALFGPGIQINTVSGYVVYDIWLTVALIGGIWGLMASTKLLRGEEDAGRWEILLSGRVTRGSAVAQAVGALLAGVGVAWIFTAIIIVLSGTLGPLDVGPRPALYFAVTLLATAMMFVGVGAVTSQVGATRRQAAAYAGWILGVSYALRMVADSGTGVHWLIWLSPLGWVEQLKPLTTPSPVALLPIFAFTGVLGWGSVALASRRDIGSGAIRERSHIKARLSLLTGHFGLTVRLFRPVVTSWAIAVAATGLLLGYVGYAAGKTISESPMSDIYERLGASGTGIEMFLGVSFLILAVVVTFVAIGQVTAARAEEAEGHLDLLLSGPLSRTRWLVSRLGLAVSVLVLLGLLSGLSTWVGVALGTTKVSLPSVMAAGLNIVAPAVFVLGMTTLGFGWFPRATSTIGYGILAWSFLVEIIGGIGAMNRWLFDTSIFHQMSAAPAVSPNITSDSVMVAIGALAAILGCVLFYRRDVQRR